MNFIPRIPGYRIVTDRRGRPVVRDGGMARVYRAVHAASGEVRAVKVLRDDLGPGSRGWERFRHEALITRTLCHFNIVRVFEVCLNLSAPHRYMVMEWLEGESLSERLRREGRLKEKEVVRISGQICDALHYIHSLSGRRVYHRDLKPSNIILERGTGRVVLIDFGIALSRGSKRLTEPLSYIGTVEYMSPDQVSGQTPDGRADLYSLGAVMYEMAAGRVPFTADNPLAVLQMHCSRPPDPPRRYNRGISERLEAVILRLLEKNPARRFQCAAAVKAALWGMPGIDMSRPAAAPRRRTSAISPLFVALTASAATVLIVVGALFLARRHLLPERPEGVRRPPVERTIPGPVSLARSGLQELEERAEDLSGRFAVIESSFLVPDPLPAEDLFMVIQDLDEFRAALNTTIAEAKEFSEETIESLGISASVKARLTARVGQIEQALAFIRDQELPSLEMAAAEAIRAAVLATAGDPDAEDWRLRSLRVLAAEENLGNGLLARRMPAAGRDLETLLSARLDEGDFELRTVSPSLEGLLRSHYGDSYEARPEYYQSSIESIHAPPIRPVGIVLLPPRGLLDALAVQSESGERGDEVIRDGAGRTAEAVLETRGEGFGEAGRKLALDFLARAERIGLRDSDWVEARKDQLTADQRKLAERFILNLSRFEQRIEAAYDPARIRTDYLTAQADFSGNELQLALATVEEDIWEVGHRLDEIGEKIEEQGRAALSAAAEAIARGGESRRPRAEREAELGSAAESLTLAASWLGEEDERVREGSSDLEEARLALTVAGSRNELLDIVGSPQLAALEAEYDYDDITGNNLEAAAALSALEVIRGRDFAEYRGIYGRTAPNLLQFVIDHYRSEISSLLKEIDRQPESGGWLGLARDYVEPRRLESIARRMTILYYDPGGGERLPERFRDEFRRGLEDLGKKMAGLREEVLRRNIGQTANRWSPDWNERRWDAEVSKGYTGAARARPGEVPAEMDPGFFRTGPYPGVLSPLPLPTPQPSLSPKLTPPIPFRTPAPPPVITPEKPEESPAEVWIQLDSRGMYAGGFISAVARHFYFSERPTHSQLQNNINKIAEANDLMSIRGDPVFHPFQWLRIPNPRYNWEGLPTSRPE